MLGGQPEQESKWGWRYSELGDNLDGHEGQMMKMIKKAIRNNPHLQQTHFLTCYLPTKKFRMIIPKVVTKQMKKVMTFVAITI